MPGAPFPQQTSGASHLAARDMKPCKSCDQAIRAGTVGLKSITVSSDLQSQAEVYSGKLKSTMVRQNPLWIGEIVGI